MKKNNIVCNWRGENGPDNRCGDGGDADRRREILNLFLADNPAFEVCLRRLRDRRLPDNDRIVLKAYEDEPLAAQIKRHCLNLQSVLFTLSVFPEAKIPDEVLDGFFEMAGELIFVLHHLADDAGGYAGEPSGPDAHAMELISRQKVPALALLGMLRGSSL